MLPLAAAQFPTTPEALSAALIAGFAAQSVTVKSVRAEGAGLATLDALRVDLTGAKIGREFRVAAQEEKGAAVLAERFELVGEPVEVEGAPVQARVEAERAALRMAGAPGNGALVLESAARGFIELAVAREALEALLLTGAKAAAGKQGVDVKKVRLTLTERGPRALAFRADVTAKMFLMSAELSLSGELAVDEQLNARVSGLALGGDAMITKIAGTFARPHLEKLEGRVFALGAVAPDGLPLREVKISARAGLEVRAEFGQGV